MRFLAKWFLVCLLGTACVVGCHKANPLPELSPIPAFSLTDQAGKPFTADSMHGAVWAAAFIFTRCPSACPRVTRAMRGVQMDAKNRGVPLRLASFSVDPDNDTPEVLLRYASEYGADTSTWTFVTGDVGAIRKTAEQGFKVAAEGTADPAKADFGIMHGTQLVLVDQAGEIRGYYATNDEQALRKIVTDAATLTSK